MVAEIEIDSQRELPALPRQHYVHAVNDLGGALGGLVRSGKVQDKLVRESITSAGGRINPAKFDQNLFGGKIARLPKWILPSTGLVLLVCGAANMLLLEWQNSLESPKRPGGPLEPFEAPFVQQLAMCLGEIFCFVFHFIDLCVAKRRGVQGGMFDFSEEEEDLEDAKPYIWIVPALCDYVFSLTLVYALLEASASEVQALRSSSVLLCALASVTFLHRDMRIFHWIGVFLITIGLVITSWVSVATYSDDNNGTSWLGPVLTLIGSSAQVFQLVFEERLLVNYRCSPFRGIAYIGCWHLLIVVCVTIIVHSSGGINVEEWWYQIYHNNLLMWGLIAYSFSMSCFASCALAVTKMGAALLTSIMMSTRQIPIWAVELGLGWIDFSILALVGIVFCVGGHLVYNKLFPSGCWRWWDRISMYEVRMRCTCHDVNDEVTEDWSEEGSEGDLADEPFENNKPSQKPGKDAVLLKTAVITGGGSKPSATSGEGSDNQSTWICIRRSEEWITDADGIRKK